MLIAREKKKENIAEYILYMWQIEDMIRASSMDLQTIEQNIIAEFDQPVEVKAEMRQWYQDLIAAMRRQRLTERGHLAETNEVVVELGFLHRSLATVIRDPDYQAIFRKALPYIEDYQRVANHEGNEIEACLEALYRKLLLRLGGRTITPETEEAFDQFRLVLAYLAKKYNEMKSGQMPGLN